MGKHTIGRMQRQCLSKRSYRIEQRAQQAVNRMWKNNKIRARYYWCEYCAGFHITTRPERKQYG